MRPDENILFDLCQKFYLSLHDFGFDWFGDISKKFQVNIK